MVNDDIERLHRFGMHIKQKSDQLPPINKKKMVNINWFVSVKNLVFSLLTHYHQVLKQKKTAFMNFLSYQRTCVELKQKKLKLREKATRSSSVRLIEKKYQFFNRTILIRRRKKLTHQFKSYNQKVQHHSTQVDDQSLLSSSGLFDVPISEE